MNQKIKPVQLYISMKAFLMKNDNIILHCRRNIVREKHLVGIQFITSNNCQKKKKDCKLVCRHITCHQMQNIVIKLVWDSSQQILNCVMSSFTVLLLQKVRTF